MINVYTQVSKEKTEGNADEFKTLALFIIMMAVCKASTLQLEALNKHNTHDVH